MRNLSLLRLALPAALLAAATFAACGGGDDGDDGNSDGNTTPDARHADAATPDSPGDVDAPTSIDAPPGIDATPTVDSAVDATSTVDSAIDAPTTVDSAIDGPILPDAPEETCTFATTEGPFAATSLLGNAADFPEDNSDPDNPVNRYVDYYAATNADAFPDGVEIELYAGYGVFLNGITTGTFTITGDELDYATCGLCISGLGNIDTAGNTYQQKYFQTGGQVTLTSVDGNLTGSFQNLTFADEDTGMCTTTLNGITFNTPYDVQSRSARVVGHGHVKGAKHVKPVTHTRPAGIPVRIHVRAR